MFENKAARQATMLSELTLMERDVTPLHRADFCEDKEQMLRGWILNPT